MNLKTYKAPKTTVEIPTNFEVEVADYHEFSHVQYLLKTTIGLNCEFEEVGCDGMYCAVFWIGKKPTELIEATKKTYEN